MCIIKIVFTFRPESSGPNSRSFLTVYSDILVVWQTGRLAATLSLSQRPAAGPPRLCLSLLIYYLYLAIPHKGFMSFFISHNIALLFFNLFTSVLHIYYKIRKRIENLVLLYLRNE